MMPTNEAVKPRTEFEEKQIRRQIVRAYSSRVVRWYCQIRFVIINLRILNELEQYLPRSGQILDIGCGFGLFSHYFALTAGGRRMISFDLQGNRIQMAQEAARLLGDEDRVNFVTQDVLQYTFSQPVDAMVTLDLLHHIPTASVPHILRCCYSNIRDEGILLVKDIEARPRYKVLFTWILDKLMDPRTPVNYYSRQSMTQILTEAGFEVRSHQILDILPYPHILYICRKRKSSNP